MTIKDNKSKSLKKNVIPLHKEQTNKQTEDYGTIYITNLTPG